MNFFATAPLGRGLLRPLIGIMSLTLLAACSDSDDDDDVISTEAPYQELYDQGIDRYMGVYSPMSTSEEDGVTNYHFGAGDGPLCLRGDEYTMATRDQGSEDLVIFLQGGGACWQQLCAATSTAGTGIPSSGILSMDPQVSPVADWNVVYMPYCDGGVHASDQDVDEDNDGSTDLYHRGLHNTSAALDVAANTFPAPRRIVLVGVSGGGYGTGFALPLLRQLYPDVPIELINDSGVGITTADDAYNDEQYFEYWNIKSFFAASCDECLKGGNPTSYHDWLLNEDDNVRLAMLSHKRDSTIGDFFLSLGGEAFEAMLLNVVAAVEDLYPDRVRSFIRNGSTHTFLGGSLDQTAGGVVLRDWITDMLEGSDDWQSAQDPEPSE